MKNLEQMNIVWVDKKSEFGPKLILFFFSPILSVIYSVKNLSSKSSFYIIFLFCLLFGLAFTVSNFRSELSIDGISYRMIFEEWTNYSWKDYIIAFKEYISFETGTRDFYVESISFFVSRITTNYHFLFMTLAAVFAYFQLKTLRFLTSNSNFNNGIICLILVFFFLWNQIFNINGCRFWTAAWIGVYSAFQIFGNGRYKYLILALITPFVHGSFWIFVIIITLALLTRHYKKFWFILFILSFVFSGISVTIIQNLSDNLPPFLFNFIDYYTGEENLSRLDSYQGWRTWFNYFTRLYPSVLILVLLLCKDKEQTYSSENIFGVLLILASVANFTISIPTLGSRFMVLTYPLICYCWLSSFSTNRYRAFIYLIPFFWLGEIYDIIPLYNLVVDPLSLILSPLYTIIKLV